MASGAIFDLMRLLRVAPLITSTGSLVYAASELLTCSAFLQPELRKKSDGVLPRWFSFVFNRGVGIVLFYNIGTTSTTIANLMLEHRGPPSLSTKFYLAGLVAAFSHLAFIPWVMMPVKHIVEDSSEEGASSEMGKWLSVHKVRMVVADFPAWLAFLGAVLTSAAL